MNTDDTFKKNVKSSFTKAREDMLKLENSLLSLKQDIQEIKAQIQGKSSIGNKGVLNKQTNQQTNKQLNTSTLIEQSSVANRLNDDIEAHFKSLTRQEFLVFLSLYQLEEEIGTVRFVDIAQYLKLSESSVRGYVNRLTNKGSPIIRKKVNNKVINLSLSPDFKALNLKKHLSEIYYHSDTSQKRLFDTFKS